ncbi:MAG: metallophosphoesterase [Eggerthellaceae bacterium]|nr:metallophosphoesterase [Eggerthellaceae bacterium]
MKIGVISDIHGPLSESARKALEGVDQILCAGDLEMPQTFWELESIAPTIAVAGNCDAYVRHVLNLPLAASPRIDGVRFYMVHRPEDIGNPPEDVQMVIYGHTHIPRDETFKGMRYLNPGSARLPRRGSVRSCAIMEVENGSILDVRFVDLEQL